VLPVHSNNVAIDATTQSDKFNFKSKEKSKQNSQSRPVQDLEVVQVIDTRDTTLQKDKCIKFEISATGRGVIPPLERMLVDLENAVPGYSLNRDKIETEAIRVVGIENTKNPMMGFGANAPTESDTYVNADADGLFRLPTTRKWILRFEPNSVTPDNLVHVPQLSTELTGSLRSERFIDMDLVTIDEKTFPLLPSAKTPVPLLVGGGIAAILLPALGWSYLRNRRKSTTPEDVALRLPQQITPFSAVITLQRFAKHYSAKLNPEEQGRLQSDIADLEKRFFAAGAKADPKDAQEALHRWHKLLANA